MANAKPRRPPKQDLNFELDLIPGPIKAAARNATAVSDNLWMVPVDKIERIEGFNVRVADRPEYVRHIESLADSILREGFYPDKALACFVSKDDDGTTHFKLVDGYSRLAAVHLLIDRGVPVERLPVSAKPPGTSMEDLTVALDRANTGLELTPYEKALVCHRLTKMGNSVDVIANRLGYTEKYVQDLLAVLGLSNSVLRLVRTGEVPAALAVRMNRKHGTKTPVILQEALDRAKGAGKPRLTERFIPPELRVSAQKVRREPLPKKKNVAQDSDFYRAAIEYAVSRLKGPSASVSWLKDFLAADPAAVGDLEAFMGQPEGSLEDRELRVGVRPNGSRRAAARTDVDDL